MKKLLAILLSLAMVLSLAACGGKQEPTTTAPATTEAPATTAAPTEAPTTAPTTAAPTTPAPTTQPAPEAMSYEEFMAAENEAEVTILATIQLAAYNKEYGNASLFLADKDGAYFVYRMPVDEKDGEKMKEGTVLLIKGNKTEWSGEVEIGEGATYEIVEGAEPYTSEALDVTELIRTEALIDHMNQRISIKGALIAPSVDGNDNDAPFLYKYNGSGEQGDDIYFNIRLGHEYYNVLVESDEFGADTDVYKAAEELDIWATVELEGFLYWYEGPQPHITSIKLTQEAPTPMDMEAFEEAPMDSEVLVDAFVQHAVYNEQEGYVNLFLDGPNGAYYVYKMNVTPEEAKRLTEEKGLHVWVKGLKTSWSGEVEITDGFCEYFRGTEISVPEDVTALMGDSDQLMSFMNRLIRIQGAQVAPSVDADEKEQPFLYKWNGSGEEGDDLYFTVSLAGQDYVMCVESDECPAGSEVYEAVKKLKIGDYINLEGFLYWYEGPQPHIHKIEEGEASQGMSFLDFMVAEIDAEVTVDSYVQLSAYDAEKGVISFFMADPAGGSYYVYQMPVTEEEAAQITEGAHLLVSGYKREWSGEVEILEAKFQLLEGQYRSEAADLTFGLSEDSILPLLMNGRMSVSAAVVCGTPDAEEKLQPFLYKWNGSGEEGDDIYFNLLVNGKAHTFVVESSEFGADSDLYKAVQALKIGDVLDVEAFLYWYEGPQPHVCGISSEAYAKQSEEALSYGQYLYAEVDSAVVVEGFVQQTTSYWEEDGQGKISLYLDDKAGSYYVYNLPVTEEEAEKLSPGTLVRISGTKTVWSELPEIIDASFEILESDEKHLALPMPAMFLFKEDADLVPAHLIGRHIMAKELVVEPSQTESGEEVPFLYKWNGSGEEGDDIYFKLSYRGQTITAVVETDEFDKDSDVYKAAQSLEIGDVVDINAYLYWYNGPQPHVSSFSFTPYAKEEGALRYREFVAAEKDEAVTIDAYVQQVAYIQSDEGIKVNLFLNDRVGSYYVYGMEIQENDLEKLRQSVRLMISGTKTEWSGEVEIIDVSEYKFVEQSAEDVYLASPIDLTDKLGNEELLNSLMNSFFRIRGAEVIASEDADGKEQPFLYKWNGSGEEGDDIYFKVKSGDTELTLVVETDELAPEGLEYKTAQELKVGDTIDLTAFLYFYEGPQPHLYSLEILVPEE